MQYFSLPTELMNITLNMSRKQCGRRTETSMAIARALAYKAKVDVELPQEANVRGAIGAEFDRIVSEFNSLIPLNLQEVRDFTKKWAAYRHDQITGNICVPYGRGDMEVEDFFGYSKYFDSDCLKCVRECPDEMTRLVVDINRILDHICKVSCNNNGEVKAL